MQTAPARSKVPVSLRIVSIVIALRAVNKGRKNGNEIQVVLGFALMLPEIERSCWIV